MFTPSTGQGLAPGHKARLQSFEEFEMKFKECLSNSAIQTKFEQHYKQGLSVVQELEGVLAEEERRIQKERYSTCVYVELDYSNSS